jgi:hypothetical protein
MRKQKGEIYEGREKERGREMCSTVNVPTVTQETADSLYKVSMTISFVYNEMCYFES